MYVISICRTQPGTDTNVTPESEEPIMPMATMYHGERRLPRKKASLSAADAPPRPVIQAMSSSRPK